MQRFVLFTEWYQPASAPRRAELRRALDENMRADAIAEIVLFAETLEVRARKS